MRQIQPRAAVPGSVSSIDHATETCAVHTDNGLSGAALAAALSPALFSCALPLLNR